jgi:hypothetical protein
VTAWNQSQAYLLVSIPLFILFGDILFRSGIANDMYAAIAPWLNRVPGKLMQTNIATRRAVRGNVRLERGNSGDDRLGRHPGGPQARL